MAQLVLYGSNVADATLTTACDMASALGGVETSSTTGVFSGGFSIGEFTSQTTASATDVGVIPATPTGKGWVYAPGAGTFAPGNWSASLAISDASGQSYAIDLTLRFSKYSSGAYTPIGTLTSTGGTMTASRQVFTFAATALASATFGTGDLLYVELWGDDQRAGNLDAANFRVYVSSSATAGVASDMQITTADFAPPPPGDPVLYGSNVANATLASASTMAVSTGGIETSVVTTFTGGAGNFGEYTSRGGTVLQMAAIPATPTGLGWVYAPGVGSFAAGNWTAAVTVAMHSANFVNAVRYFKWSGGVYTLLGSTSFTPTVTTKATYTVDPVAVPQTAFLAGELLYVDMWYQNGTGAGGDTGTVYVSTSAVSGVANDMQITTTSFVPAPMPPFILRAFTGTRQMRIQPLYIPRAFTGTRIRSNTYPKYILRAFTGTRISVVTGVLAGACAGVGTLTGALALSTQLSGECDGIGTLTGTVGLTTALSGTVAGVGQLAGTFSLATSLSANLAGVGTLSGTLTANLTLPAVTVPGVGTASGALSLSTALAGTAPGVGQLSATFSLATSLSATGVGAGTCTGALSLATALSGTCAGVGTCTGSLGTTAPVALSGTISGVGTITGTLSLSTSLSSSVSGVGALSGVLSLQTALSVSISGVGTLTGTAQFATALGGTVSGAGTCTATMTLKTALSATVAGVGTLSGTLTAAGQAALTGTASGVGQISGAFSLVCALSGTASGSGLLSGVFSLRCALFVTCAGAGTLSGTLSIPGGPAQFLSGIWVTRDLAGTWKTRDLAGVWNMRDEQGIWDSRDDQGTWRARDEKATWNTRG